MRRIFIFTAGDREARRHLDHSIRNTVSVRLLDEHLSSVEAGQVRAVLRHQDGFYAWGAIPGERNTSMWEAMNAGDVVLAVYGNKYRYVASVLSKIHSEKLAKSIWGEHESGGTWEYMYFLSKPEPVEISVPESPLSELLNKGYRGFTKISSDKVARITRSYGSIDGFVGKFFTQKWSSEATELELLDAEAEAALRSEFDPSDIGDGRKRVVAEIVRRRGQPRFRQKLLDAYERRCAISGCDVEMVLEAAHIIPYLGDSTNHVTNGILLRADLHTLFDLGKVRVDADGLIHVSDELRATEYGKFHGMYACLPSDEGKRPSLGALSTKFAGTT